MTKVCFSTDHAEHIQNTLCSMMKYVIMYVDQFYLFLFLKYNGNLPKCVYLNYEAVVDNVFDKAGALWLPDMKIIVQQS